MPKINGEGDLSSGENSSQHERDKANWARFLLWRRRAIYANLALLLSFGLVYPFITGRPLSSVEEFAKQVLLLVALAMIFIALYVNLLLWGA
jgi:hypothetical protein